MTAWGGRFQYRTKRDTAQPKGRGGGSAEDPRLVRFNETRIKRRKRYLKERKTHKTGEY